MHENVHGEKILIKKNIRKKIRKRFFERKFAQKHSKENSLKNIRKKIHEKCLRIHENYLKLLKKSVKSFRILFFSNIFFFGLS